MSPTKEFKHDAFISYASEDRPWAERLEAELTTKGLDVFLRQVELFRMGGQLVRMDGGRPEVLAALAASQHLILLQSRYADDSVWVDEETVRFRVYQESPPERRIVQVLLDGDYRRLPGSHGIGFLRNAGVYENGPKAVHDAIWASVVEWLEDALRTDTASPAPVEAASADTPGLLVFLCHSSDDKATVRRLEKRLRDDGFRTWLDQHEILPGQDWDREIRRAVRDADVVVVCLSAGSTTKAGYVQKEVKHVLDVADEQPEGALFLIPARLEECDVPERLRRWQWVDLHRRGGYKRLVAALRLRGDPLREA